MSSAAWFPARAEFRSGLARARARGRHGATICAVLGADVLTFRDADTNTWLAEVHRA
jgi:hypothetical protein